jgi:perosamine synthetase
MASDAVRAFERAFAQSQQAPAARAFWKGRAGLYALLKVFGVGAGDRVGLCAFTCLGVVEPVTRLRATPIFLDVDEHLNLSVAALERLAQPLKALIVQHTFGVPCDLPALLAWAERQHVPVIEDCCHALDSTWDGKRVGSFTPAALFGFEWGKSFSTGQGGMVVLRDAALLKEVDRVTATEGVRPTWRQAGGLAAQRGLYRWLVTPRTRTVLRSLYRRMTGGGHGAGNQPQAAELIGPAPGFLKGMSPSQARAGLTQLRLWPENRARRMEAASQIFARLRAAGLTHAPLDARAAPVWLRVPVWVGAKQRALLAAEGEHLDLAGWYSSPAHPLHGPVLAELGYDPTACPAAERAFVQVVTLPTRPALDGRQLDRAVRIVEDAGPPPVADSGRAPAGTVTRGF